MQHDQRPPFPTPIEIVRVIANAFNTKFSNKAIDDMALKTDIDYRSINQFVIDAIQEPVAKILGEDISQHFKRGAENLIKSYLLAVSSISLDGVPRSQTLPILLECFFPKYAAEFLFVIHKSIGGPNPISLLSCKERALDVVISWIEKHEVGWSQYLHGCTKEERDRIAAWKRGIDLPTHQYIGLLQTRSQGPWHENINWPRVKALLLIARALDWANSQEVGTIAIDSIRKIVWSSGVTNTFSVMAKQLQEQNLQRLREVTPLIHLIQHGLLRTSLKRFIDKEKFIEIFYNARKILNRVDPYATSGYWLDWHEGRWHVFSGDLESACQCYRKAFEGCLYRSGENQRFVIEECLVVAASLERPDKVFLKRLKNMAITFGYDIPSVTSGIGGTNKASDFIEDWEINLWAAHFSSVFPDGDNHSRSTARKGPLLVNLSSIHPDYRHPNRNIKIGETWQKTFPQLVWFAMRGEVEIVEKLLKKQADVDVFSDANDSPLLTALEAINAFSPTSSMDDSVLKVLLQYIHKPETINTRTSKKRLLPLISAVESGRVDVVNKLLEMGADPNLKGDTDDHTPLIACLKRLAMVKYPEKYWKIYNDRAITPQILDTLRRYSNGLSGFTLEQQKNYLEKVKGISSYQECETLVQHYMTEKAVKFAPIASLREIAILMIKSGADPNNEHLTPFPGYTPMMLAAELDEIEIFEVMLDQGGDPKKFYINPDFGFPIDCITIAKHFRAERIFRKLRAHKF